MSRNAIITFAYGKEFLDSTDFKIFVKSCEKINADLIFVPQVIEIKNILRDRHLCYFSFLKSCDYDKCLICDSRDVIIQDDPFSLESDFALTSEGMRHCESTWNISDQYFFQRNLNAFHIDKSNDLVINGGVMYGKPSILANFCFLIWSNGLKSDSSDQAIVNYFNGFFNPDIPDYDFCITGEGIKEGFVEVSEKNGSFFYKNKLCKIFHQWDRTQWAGVIREKFKV